MEAKKRNIHTNQYTVHGTAARQLEVLPGYLDGEGTAPNREPLRQPVKRPKRRAKAKPGIDLFGILMLTVAIGITFYTCVEYLGVQADTTKMNNEITSLERELLKLQNQNDAALSKVNTSLDLSYIYQVATEELGMMYPDSDQILNYKSNLSDYVRQYGEVPEIEPETLLEKFLKEN
jgi:cell division protein FtsL